MAQSPAQTSDDNKGYLYAHVSRLYNGGFNALTATIFGLLAYLSVFINKGDYLSDFINKGEIKGFILIIGFILIGRIIVIMILYFYYRLIFYGRWMERIEEDLHLDWYKYNNMQCLAKFHPEMNQNPFKHFSQLTKGEFYSLVLLFILIFISNSILIIWDFLQSSLSCINYIVSILPCIDYGVFLYYVIQIKRLDPYKSLAERVQTKLFPYENDL